MCKQDLWREARASIHNESHESLFKLSVLLADKLCVCKTCEGRHGLLWKALVHTGDEEAAVLTAEISTIENTSAWFLCAMQWQCHMQRQCGILLLLPGVVQAAVVQSIYIFYVLHFWHHCHSLLLLNCWYETVPAAYLNNEHWNNRRQHGTNGSLHAHKWANCRRREKKKGGGGVEGKRRR